MPSRFAAQDIEGGNISSKNQMRRALAKRRYNSFPARVLLSFLTVFLVFLVIGSLKTSYSVQNDRLTKSKGSSKSSVSGNTGQPTLFTFSIVQEYDHDPTAFTQGFEVLRDGLKLPQGSQEPINAPRIIESTGLRGQSSVREVDLLTGKVIRQSKLSDQDFGEGITRLGDTLYQLTWQRSKLITYKVDDFSDRRVLSTHLQDGWGITNDGVNLIAGDSTHTLYYIDPKSMKTVKQIDVTDDGRKVKWLNELEWVDGLIYANVWQKECIAQIEPNSGSVVGWVDLSGITSKVMAENSVGRIDVLNGIAWDEVGGKLYITGKLWPKVYQIELRPMYIDSKTTDVNKMTADVRERCIIG
jgi:glutamine cyclotransferase